jgi:hypothetical protein
LNPATRADESPRTDNLLAGMVQNDWATTPGVVVVVAPGVAADRTETGPSSWWATTTQATAAPTTTATVATTTDRARRRRAPTRSP